MGVALASQGRFQEAIAEYQKSLNLDPNSALVQNNLQEAYQLLSYQLIQQQLSR